MEANYVENFIWGATTSGLYEGQNSYLPSISGSIPYTKQRFNCGRSLRRSNKIGLVVMAVHYGLR